MDASGAAGAAQSRVTIMVQLLMLLLELYIALGLMLVGFGYMLQGKNGGARAARFYFANSLWWSWWRMRRLVTVVLASISGVLMFWILRPLMDHVWRGTRWFVTRERGWLRPR
jgi:hypothetical protein